MKNKTIIIIAIAIAAYFLYKKATYKDPNKCYSNSNAGVNVNDIIKKSQSVNGLTTGPEIYTCPNCGRMLQLKRRELSTSSSKSTNFNEWYYHCNNCNNDFTPTEIILRTPLY